MVEQTYLFKPDVRFSNGEKRTAGIVGTNVLVKSEDGFYNNFSKMLGSVGYFYVAAL